MPDREEINGYYQRMDTEFPAQKVDYNHAKMTQVHIIATEERRADMGAQSMYDTFQQNQSGCLSFVVVLMGLVVGVLLFR